MRRTLWILIGVLAASIAVCLFSMFAQFNAIDEMERLNSSAMETAHAGDMESAGTQLVILANMFKDRAKVLEMLASHEDLHEAYSDIVDAQIAIESNDRDDAYQAMTRFNEALEHIREHERLNWRNIY